MVKVAFLEKYFDSLAKLSGEENKQANKAVMLFQRDPQHQGLNYEKLNHFKDKKLRSIRVNQDVRIILAKTDQEDLYLFLNVGHHDDVYGWAKDRKVDINPNTGVLQVYSSVEVSESEPDSDATQSANVPGLFDHIKDKHLLQLGVPEDVIPNVRDMKIEADLENALDGELLPQEAYDALFIVMAGGSFEEAWAEANPQEQYTETQQVNVNDYEKALDKAESRRRFVVAEDETELEAVLSESLEKWRVFLHPLQRKLSEGVKNGPVRVLGGAGTGKTVVAMHRAKWLARHVATEERKVFFTTFTKDLAADIRQNLANICTAEELKRVEVLNLDAWVMSYLKCQGYDYNLLLSSKEEGLMWKQAYSEKPADIDLELAFFKEEWAHVVQPQSIESVDQYKRASRIGRGTRLSREQRVSIWPVFAEYRKQLLRSQYKEVDDAYRDASHLMENDPDKMPSYCAIIVDEAQDMGTQAFMLIRNMVAKGKNDLFIVGDGHQRIYGRNKVVLGRCGIDIRGRSARLKINYRTTDETRKLAVGVLEGVEIDDLDGGKDTQQYYHSLMHGPEPTIKLFKSLEEQCEEIHNVVASVESRPSACCVIARTNKEVRAIKGQLDKLGSSTYVLEGRSESPGDDFINLATMHRVKGLEFDYVFLASANKDLVPLSFIVDAAGDPVTRRQKENEERALVYVSLTRARKQAFIFGYGELSDWFMK